MSLLSRLFGSLGRAGAQAGSAETLAARGMQHLARNESEAARQAFEAALARDAGCAPAHCGLGVLLQQQGARDAAREHLQLAARLDADNRTIVLRSAQALDEMGCAEEAIAILEPVAAAHPADWKASVRLARLLRAREKLDDASALLERTVAANPAAGVAMEELAALYRATGRIEPMLELFERICALHPDLPTTHSAVMFHEAYRVHDRLALAQRHRAWARRFAPPRAAPRFPNAPQAERRLRIGYVSADFRRSSASPFIEPLLAARDAGRFHVTCYNAWKTRDAVSERLQGLADAWIDVAELDDDALEARVRADAIDILVDLNGHTTGNRLPAFSRQLAPVQATYLGYGATTGMTTIGYRITDAVIDPPGASERYYSERLLYLPDAMWCFVPPADMPPPGAPRAADAVPTFGMFNNFAKASPAAIEAWADILARSPQARLLLVGVPAGSARARLRAPFEARGVDAGRLEFHERVSYDAYCALHREVDIALDTFPYAGGATTCDALWLGVPVLTLAGDAVLARSGASLLSAAGLREWIAHSPEDYVERALRLVAARDALAALRSGLRERVAASALCDAPRFMRGFEGLLRDMWRAYCATAPG